MVFYDYLLNLVAGEIVRRREADALMLPAERIRVCREALSDPRAIETLGDEMRVERTPQPIGCLFIWSKGVLCSMSVFLRDEEERDYLPTIHAFLLNAAREYGHEPAVEWQCDVSAFTAVITTVASLRKPDISPILSDLVLCWATAWFETVPSEGGVWHGG